IHDLGASLIVRLRTPACADNTHDITYYSYFQLDRASVSLLQPSQPLGIKVFNMPQRDVIIRPRSREFMFLIPVSIKPSFSLLHTLWRASHRMRMPTSIECFLARWPITYLDAYALFHFSERDPRSASSYPA